MKKQIYNICTQLNDGQITVTEATEQLFDLFSVIDSFSMQDLMLYYQDAENFDFASKAIEVLNSMVMNR